MLYFSNFWFLIVLRWCAQDDEIKKFFTVIKRELPEMREGAFDETVKDGKVIDNVYLSTTKKKSFLSIDSGYLINSKEYKNKINWVSSVSKKLNYSYDQRSKEPPDWSDFSLWLS